MNKMPPKKKAPKNGFFYFMMELKDSQPKKYKNMQEVQQAAGELWLNMTEEKKKTYDLRAKSIKHDQKVIKYTSTGENIELVQKEQTELIQKEQQMKDEITETIHLAKESGTLPDLMFHICHVNYFCYCNSDKRYYPAEIGIVRFNLRNGVLQQNIFNQICNPGTLPLGYMSAAKQISESSHRIPPPLSCDLNYNLNTVAESVWSFITNTNGELSPIYVINKNQAVVENVLNCFSVDFGLEQLRVFSLEHLFFVLRNNCSDEIAWVTSSLGKMELERDKYEFCKDIPCPYHHLSEVPNYCSQSQVIRIIYNICDNCCPNLGIQLIPGQHVPTQSDTRNVISNSRVTSSASSTIDPNENHHRYKQSRGYLSQAEPDCSAMSETSTVVDVNDIGAVGGFEPGNMEKSFPSLPQKKGYFGESKPKQPLRRPTTMSAALTGAITAGKGRGKGIGANFFNSHT